jgi:hypothetical protein
LCERKRERERKECKLNHSDETFGIRVWMNDLRILPSLWKCSVIVGEGIGHKTQLIILDKKGEK